MLDICCVMYGQIWLDICLAKQVGCKVGCTKLDLWSTLFGYMRSGASMMKVGYRLVILIYQ